MMLKTFLLVVPLGLALSLALLYGDVNQAVATQHTASQQAPTPHVISHLRRLGVEQGLSQSSAYALLQDARGFVWIGTADGLNKYDGSSFTVYRHIASDSTSLSDNFIQVLLEDRSKRWLWVGTRDGGLNRFDRTTGTFTSFQHHPQGSRSPASAGSSLSSNVITALVQDSSGALWIGTDGGGLNRLDTRTGAVTRFQHDEQRTSTTTTTPANANINTSINSNVVLSLCLDSAGTLWIGTDVGLDCFRPYQYQQSQQSRPLQAQNKQVQVATFTHCFYQGSAPLPMSSSMNASINSSAISPSSDAHIYALAYRAASQTLWIGTGAGLYQCALHDSANHSAKHLTNHSANRTVGTQSLTLPVITKECSDESVRCLHGDRTSGVWACTATGGIYHADGQGTYATTATTTTTTMTAFHRMNAEVRAWSGSGIYSIMQDQSGLVWAGTYSGGIITFLARSAVFTTFTHDPANPTSERHLNRFAVTSLLEDAAINALWVGTLDGGLNRFDREHRTFTVFRHRDGDAHGLPSDVVRAIYRDRSGTLWVATQDGLAMMNADGRTFPTSFTTFRHDPRNPHSISSNNVFCVFEDSQGALWVGTLGGGLNRFDRSTQRFTVFKHDPMNPRSISGNIIRALCEDRTGALWVGTRGAGLNRFDPHTQDFTSFLHDEANPQSLSHNSIYGLYADGRGLLWIGTQGGGVNCLDTQSLASQSPANPVFTAFRTKDGLPNDVVYGIVEDRRGSIWLSTNKGLSRMNAQAVRETSGGAERKMSFRNYDERDGLQSNEFNAGAYCAGRDGTLYFGGIRGFTAFQPDSVLDNPFVPPVSITNFKLFNRAVKPAGKEISESEAIEISYRDNYFSFEFAALSFILPEKNRYRYKLEGFDQTWIDAGTKREAAYTNLDAGDYVFQVQGSNNDGVWNERGASVRVRITPPWWNTLWFRAVAVAFVVSASGGFMLWRIRAVRAAERISRQMAQLELQSLRLHMNPHFIFNAINSIQYLVSEGQTQAATHYLSTFARLMRKILKQHDYLAISIADELELLEMYIDLERLRYDYTFDYELHCEHRSELASLLIPAMVLQPYVENAIRHGLGTRKHGGMLSVRLERRDGLMFCVVEDNGIGRAQAQALQSKRTADGGDKQPAPHLSMATSITQRRLDILNAAHPSHHATHINVRTTDLIHADGSAAGTRVEILLPVLR
jgi:ligand-binding sensor domain-containing protein